jgi:HEAT repeat protein
MLVAAVLGGVCLLVALGLVVALVVGRAVRLRAERTQAEEEDTWRPALVRIVAGDGDAVALPRLRRGQVARFETLASELVRKVRGEGRDRLAQLLADSGAVTAARRRCRYWGASRRVAAADFLATVGDHASAPTVRPMLRDRSFEVRTAAARSIGRIGDETDVARLLATLEADRSVPFATVADALIQLGPPAIPGLRDGLRSPNVDVRAVCSEALGLLGAVDAVEDLLAHLHPVEDDEIRIRCTRALGRIGTPRAVAPLARITSTTEPATLRAVAVRSLGRLGGPAAVAALAPLLDDDVHTVAVNTAGALLACGDIGSAALRERAARPGRGAGYAREALARAEAVVPEGSPPDRWALLAEPHLTESP